MSDQNRDQYLTRKDAAAYLRVSTATVRRWSRTGKITAYRTDHQGLRFLRAELDWAMRIRPVDGSADADPRPVPSRSGAAG